MLELGAAGFRALGSLAACRPSTKRLLGPPQTHFLNAAVRMRTEHSAAELLVVVLEIEQSAGRERRERWGRERSTGLLWIDGRASTAGLSVPHPRLPSGPSRFAPTRRRQRTPLTR